MYHVTLNGQGYLLDVRKYVRRAHRPFAPKTASGDRGYEDLAGPEQGYRVSDWSGGEGLLQADHEHPQRWRAGYGVDVFSEPGSLRLGPQLAALPPPGGSSATEYTVATVYKGALYVGVHGHSAPGLYRWDGSTWSRIIASGDPYRIRAMAQYLGKLYVGYDSYAGVSSWDGTTYVATAFTVASATAIRAMATFYRQATQYLYVAATGAQNGMVHWWDGATLSARQYQFEEPQPEVALVLGNRLYFFVGDPQSRRGAVYSVDDSGAGGVYRAHGPIPEAHPTAGVVWDGAIYLGAGLDGGIYRWDGQRLAQVRELARPGVPYGAELRGMAAWGEALWVSILDGAGGGTALLRYDGTSWTRPADGIAGGSPRALAAHGGQLYALTAGSPGAIVRTDGTFRGAGRLDLALWDAGLPSVDKVLRSVTVSHASLAAGQSVQVQYRPEDAGAWVVLGTSSTIGATSASFPFSGPTVVRQVAFRLLLAGAAGAAGSPVVYDWLLRYAPVPEPKREWELRIPLEGTPELPQVMADGRPNPLTGAEQSTALWTAKGQLGPIAFTDLDGVARQVWFEDLREEVAELGRRGGLQTVAIARLLEA